MPVVKPGRGHDTVTTGMATVLEPVPAWSSPWTQARRPWLNLYGLRLRQTKNEAEEKVWTPQYRLQTSAFLVQTQLDFKAETLELRAFGNGCFACVARLVDVNLFSFMSSCDSARKPCAAEQTAMLQVIELAPIQRLLPEELMLKILGQLQPYALGKAACVCQQWRELTLYPDLWKTACLEAFMTEKPDTLQTTWKLYRSGVRLPASDLD